MPRNSTGIYDYSYRGDLQMPVYNIGTIVCLCFTSSSQKWREKNLKSTGRKYSVLAIEFGVYRGVIYSNWSRKSKNLMRSTEGLNFTGRTLIESDNAVGNDINT